jgi:hypothetical protein
MSRAILAALLLLPIAANSGHAAGSLEFERGVVVLADYRDLAKADALFVSAQCMRNGQCGARYDFYRLMYNRTANSFDVLIRNMITKIDGAEEDDNDRYFRYTVEDAAVQFSLLKSASVKFRAYVAPDSANPPAFDLNRHINRTQKVIGGTFVRLVRAFQIGGAREREYMVGMLDGLKWTRFETLRSMAAISVDANAASHQ